MNKQRKAQLRRRAFRFSDRMLLSCPNNDNAHYGYIAGYMDAVRDMRKEVARALFTARDHNTRGSPLLEAFNSGVGSATSLIASRLAPYCDYARFRKAAGYWRGTE